MARKWEITEGVFAWNMEKCEELLLIVGYEEIKAFITPGMTWQAEFENHFFQHGNGTAFAVLDGINAVRRRRGLDRLEFVETDVLDYARCMDKLLKSETRRRLRDEYYQAGASERQRMVEKAMAEAAKLLPPHRTFEETKRRRTNWSTENLLSRAEVAKRLQATKRAEMEQQPEQAKATAALPLDRALIMLRFASDPDLRSSIIEKLSPDDALLAIEQVEDAAVRDALIWHSLQTA